MNQEGNSSFNLFQTLDHSTPSKAELLTVMFREIHNLQPMHCKNFNPHFFLQALQIEKLLLAFLSL